MPQPRPLLLYFYPAASSFVVKDRHIYEQEYQVKELAFLPKRKWQLPFSFLKQLWFLVKNIWKADVLVCMFSGYHAFFPALFGKLFQKPCLIIAGGTDSVAFPSIGYGCFQKPFLKSFTKWSYQLAAHIAPVHEKLVWQEYQYQPNDYPNQGITYFIPDLETPVTPVYNGYDPEKWQPDPEVKRRQNSFLTVCAGLHMRFTQKLKGIDLIVEAARKMPEASFTIVGAPAGFSFSDHPKNIQLLPLMPLEKLRQVYSAHQFYLQLSLSEGFPNALCEAMLCECVPVVSNVSSMPAIISESGFVLEKRDPELLVKLLQQSLKEDLANLGKSARKRIFSNFPEERREQELLGLLNQLRKQ